MDSVNKRFSGWIVVIGCILLMVFPGGLLAYTPSLYMTPICKEFGFSTTSYSLINTIQAAVNAVVSAVFVGFLSKGSRRQMKIVMFVGLVFSAGGFAMISRCSQLWHFLVMGGVWNIGYCLLTNAPVSMMINNWFVEKRATILGLVLASSKIGGTVFLSVAAGFISNYGWRMSYVISGILTFVFALLGIILIKRSPEEYGETPLMPKEGTSSEANEEKRVWLGMTKGEAMKTPVIYIMAAVLLLCGIYSAGTSAHYINYLCSEGWELTSAAKVASVYSFAGIPGIFIGGAVSNKLGLKKTSIVSGILCGIGFVLLIAASSIPSAAYVYAVIYGACNLLSNIIPPLLVGAVFGSKEYSGKFGFVYTFQMVGCAIASPVVALIANAVSYRFAWIIMVVILAVIVAGNLYCLNAAKRFKEIYAK